MIRAMAAFKSGTVIVAAAGNESKTNVNGLQIAASLPAAAEGVVSVGALQQVSGTYGIAYFQTFPVVVAQGSTSSVRVGRLADLSGTSMVCPCRGVMRWWGPAKIRRRQPDCATVSAKLLAQHEPILSRTCRGGPRRWAGYSSAMS